MGIVDDVHALLLADTVTRFRPNLDKPEAEDALDLADHLRASGFGMSEEGVVELVRALRAGRPSTGP